MAQLIEGLDAERIALRLAEARQEIAEAASVAGRDAGEVEILTATKYVASEDLRTLAAAGISLVGENRAQDMVAKAKAHPGLFVWDFIGALQSRKVRLILPHVRLIHSLASESAALEMERRRQLAAPGLEVLIEVNLSGEQDKAGVPAKEIDPLIELCPFPVTGLMTMPPAARDPEQSRRWFAALRELAQQRGLRRLSMGTTQDYRIAVQEGATIVRLGRSLLAPG